MIPNIDIWRSANVMVKRYGEDAALEAAKRADELLEAGDMDGCAIWKRIVAAVEDLQRTKPRQNEAVQ